MVAQEHVRGLQALHIYLLHFELLADQHDLGEEPDQPGPKYSLVQGVFCGFIAPFIAVIHFDVQKISLLRKNHKRFMNE
jgi:hypothetical protein